MIPELGHLLLILALALAFVQAGFALAGAQAGRADWIAVARPATVAQALLVAGAMGCLVASFVRNDFSVLYVASNSNSALPLRYRIAAVWGGHEGSLLLWIFMLAAWSLAVAWFSRSLPAAFAARVLGVMGLLAAGFLLFVLLTSNPFDRLLPAAADGHDLNPLLQDPGMIAHPPMLYMGYVGFSVAFSFAIAALLGGDLDATWARWSRPWTIGAWTFLTCGIGLGSWWAYNELGWGGWWFWDPVENASFMPWLAGTALIHSLAVTEKRGGFKGWTVLLAILAFSLSLIGTFLVRSGVLSSVHAFASDPRRGLFILAFLVVVIGSALALFAWRVPKVGLGQRFGVLSRESLLLVNNVILAVACGAVLLGTLYPLLLDALGLGKISVGPPYFEIVFVLLMVPLVAAMGIGPLTRWKQDDLGTLGRRLRGPALVTAVAALVLGALAGRISLATTIGLAMGCWIVATLALDLRDRLRPDRQARRGIIERLRLVPRSVAGMMAAHLGVAAFAFGVTMVKSYEVESDVRMGPGSVTSLAGYDFRMISVQEDLQGPNYVATQALLEVSRDGHAVATLSPQKRVYRIQQTAMTEAAVASNGLRDLYVSMGERLPGGDWVLRLQFKPFITWIWGGCLLMMLGGVVAGSDPRYRTRRRAQAIVIGVPSDGAVPA